MFAYCRNNPVIKADPVGSFDWNTLASGATLLTIGITACAVAATVLTAGACAPLMAVAATTWVAGAMTIANGASEVSESITGYNPMEQVICGGDERLYTTQKTVYAVTAEVGTVVLSVASQFGVCFVAGTRVQTADGTKNIEEIQPGDLVWSWNEETNKTELKPVVETYINEATELTHLFVGSEEIVCTPGHIFYAPKKGWTDACRLRAGDILVLVNGEYVVVEKIQHELLESPVAIYNFQVQDDHTYYVSNIGVLVHNKCTETHHIVEQCQERLSGFSRKLIQSDINKVEISPTVHRIISGFYSSKPNGPGTERVRDMLVGKSFEEQFKYGMKVLTWAFKKVEEMLK